MEGTSTVHRSLLSIPRRLAAAATLFVALGIFTGTAHAEALNATVQIKGAGSVAQLVPKGETPDFTCPDASAVTSNITISGCGAATHGRLDTCERSAEKCGFLDLRPDPADGWIFVGWESKPLASTCTGKPGKNICHVESTATQAVTVTVMAVFREDITATLSTQTKPITNSTTATFNYSFAGPDGSIFKCTLDTVDTDCGTIANHAASRTFDELDDVQHTFTVTARTPNDNPSTTQTFSWLVDITAPTATLDPTTGPGQGALQTIDSETFKFTSSESTGATFTCSLDNAAFTACTSPTTLTNLGSSAHSFRVQAIDQAGNVSTPVERNWTVAIPDADTDGFNAKVDCNDGDPGVHPGANDVADNGKDENCDGADAHIPPTTQTAVSAASPEQIQVVLSFGFKSTKRTTKFTKLQLKNIPFGATVSATCKGSSCPKALKGKGFVKKRAFGTINLKRFVKKPLKKSTTITVIVSKPGAINAVKVLKIRSAKAPTVTTRCQPPGTKKPVSC